MSNVKHTKNEMKTQKDALDRFLRFLPMLQLKKQQLQAEIQRITSEITGKEAEEEKQRSELNSWIKILSEPANLDQLLVFKSIITEKGNIAGVEIPILQRLDLERTTPDLFLSPSWVDDASEVISKLMKLRVERETLAEQRRLVTEELRTTSQRVNLFEKVKIPECKENIRTIKIFLGDEQTASVVRGKIAKRRMDAEE